MLSTLYDLPYNIYVLLFGVYISMRVACGHMGAGQFRLLSIACPALLLVQGILLQLCGVNAVRLLYPLIVHLPLIALLVFFEKHKWGAAAVSVAISYSICQLPRWIGLLLSIAGLSPIASVIIHIACSHLLLLLLDRFCLSSIHSAINGPRHLLISLGALPIIYYLYEYFMIYTSGRYLHLSFLNEFLPTGMVIFFILFVIVYQQESEKRMQTEQQIHTIEISLLHAEQEMNSLRAAEEKTAIFRHDLRHHLMMISGLLSAGKQDDAMQYIHQTQQNIDAIVPLRFCANETVNLLLSAYQSKADSQRTALQVKTDLPPNLELSDTELCAMLSNGLENALTAVQELPLTDRRFIDVFFAVRQGMLLLEIKNPYAGKIEIKNGLPLSPKSGAHYGCLSIRSIVASQQGVCTFSAENGLFTLRIAIPIKGNAIHKLH